MPQADCSSMRRLSLVVVLALVVSAPTEAQYSTGFSWNQGIDFEAGTVSGGTLGNPNPDAAGNPVWSLLRYPGGSTRDSGSPWFDQTPVLMVWDDDYLGFGGNWARADDSAPIINGDYLQHDLDDSTDFLSAPGVRWQNPLGETHRLRFHGDLTVRWTNWAGNSADVNVDVVAFHDDVSAGSRQFMQSTTVSKPGGTDTLTVDLGDQVLVVEPGDSVSVTVRAHNVVAGGVIPVTLEFFLQLLCEPGDTGCVCQFPVASPVGSGEASTPSTVNPTWNARVADDFTVTSETKLRSITWWGATYEDSSGAGCAPPSREFELRIYEDAAGFPGDPVGEAIAVSEATGMVMQLTGHDLFRNGTRLYPRRHTFELSTPIVLPAPGTYWLEIVESVGGDCYWLWQNSDEGDLRALHDIGAAGYGSEDLIDKDLAYCLDLDDGIDCNNNQIDDPDDITNGTSSDNNSNGIPDECEPELYCRAKANSQAVLPTITSNGQATLTGPDDWTLEASDVIGQTPGVLLWGLRPNPPSGSGAFGQSRLRTVTCVFDARTTGLQTSTGSAGQSDGTLSHHFTQASMNSAGLISGQSTYVQWFYRDPTHPDGSGFGHTEGMRLEVLP